MAAVHSASQALAGQNLRLRRGFEEFGERERREGLSNCTGFSCQSEFAQKTKVEAVRERREAVWVCLRRRKRLNVCLRRKRLTLLGLTALPQLNGSCALHMTPS